MKTPASTREVEVPAEYATVTKQIVKTPASTREVEVAGEFRSVNASKGGFMFAAAGQLPRLMQAYGQNELATSTPCAGMDTDRLISALAKSHAELVIVHPFRDGNGRCARLLASLMAMQAGMPVLEFSPLARRGRVAYIAAIHAAVRGDYAPMEARFERVIRWTLKFSGRPV